ncbi:MAG: DUF5009 domain-containing protein [Bacteroidetes bacterium]|nr:DUF5009 domain-containing protein [Bacteroidota bacterium]
MKELTGISISRDIVRDTRLESPATFNTLTAQRILSVDLFRGITILVMIFVNELAGMRNIPAWMKHMPRNADAMSFVDIVFPAFLFIAGMSIPFALNNRQRKGDSNLQIQKHVLWRTIGLLTLGLFMVNAESGSSPLMKMDLHIWGLLSFAAAILIWNVYKTKNKLWPNILKGIGVAILIALAFIYRGDGEDGTTYFSPHWWGILGLIGWAYLFSCIFYQTSRGKIAGLALLVITCIVVYVLTMRFDWDDYPAKNATHIAVMACGTIASLILFDEKRLDSLGQRFSQMILFAALLFMVGYILRPFYKISKINATPTWGLYSAAICVLLYSLFYWIVDIRGVKQWTSFFRPAAANPLLIYIIPDIIYHIMAYFHLSFIPYRWRYGMPGIIWSASYAIVIMWIAAGLNRLKVRLQL